MRFTQAQDPQRLPRCFTRSAVPPGSRRPYALAVAIFGGFAPFIATWLISATDSLLSSAYYVIAAAVVSFIVNWKMPETAHHELG